MKPRQTIFAALLAPLITALPGGAMAGPAETDLLFATGHLDGLAAGTTLHYRAQTRFELGHAQALPSRDEAMQLSLAPVGDAGTAGTDRAELAPVIVLDPEGRARVIEGFRGVPGNPVLMVFLENVVRSVAAATGGSPFYLRNRLRDGLREGLIAAPGEAPGRHHLSMRPFAEDRNRARLGAFAGLELVFVLDEAAPGMLTRLTARTDGAGTPAYFEEIRLETSP